MTQNLTPFQQKLVDDLIKEFTKINPKPTPNGTKRFTFETISECNKEEERFKSTITKHNLTMIKVFSNQIETELKDFKKEFGKALDIQLGYSISNGERNSLKIWLEDTKNKPLHNAQYNEIHLFIVSKTKDYSSDSRYDYCNGRKYTRIYIDFKRDYISHKLESGKVISLHKIVGLEFRLNDYLNKEKSDIKSTLDELIQTQKFLQTQIVELAS